MRKKVLRRTGSALGALVLTAAPLLGSSAWAGRDPDLEAKEVANQRTGPDDRFRATAYVTNRREMRDQWERFNMRGDVAFVPFRRRVALFALTGGSSSCPPRFGTVRLKREERRLIVRIVHSSGGPPGTACTDDFVRRTFVISVRHENLPRGELDVRVRNIHRD